jgi:predicted PurR-regulated permease PerM
LYLASGGYYVAAIGLGLWCAVVVGTVDNVLRPWLVGRDTKMPDIMILVSTLGGLVLFGAVGIIIGPIIAALFITVWELYGEAFGEVLPATSGAGDAKP